MAELLQKIGSTLQFEFAQRAIVVSILIAICASLLGVTLVLKRFSFIGEGLAHSAFFTMAFATVVGITNSMIISLPATIIVAIVLLGNGSNSKIKGDAAVAMIAVGSLALGYFLMNQFPRSGNVSADVCQTLFGSWTIMTLSPAEVWLCFGLSIVTVLFFIFFYHKIFAITFDDTFARATGVKTNLYNYLIAIVTAVTIVLAMNLVGSLLISALIIFPALSAMRVFKTFKSVTICSVVFSVVCTILGLLLSIGLSSPIGPTIVLVDIIVFVIFFIVGTATSLVKKS